MDKEWSIYKKKYFSKKIYTSSPKLNLTHDEETRIHKLKQTKIKRCKENHFGRVSLLMVPLIDYRNGK